ncbi:MAG: adenylate/guanylate cyclase domain-containing protein [Flavipsychrobacter sp.]
MKLKMTVVLLVCINICYAQQYTSSDIDSLKNIASKQQIDSSNVNTICELAIAYYRTAPDSGLIYGFEALRISKKSEWEIGQAKAYKVIAINYIALSEYAKALENLLAALEVYEKYNYDREVASIYNKLGLVYARNDNSKALSYYQKSLDLYQKINDINGVAQVYGNMGNVYFSTTNYAKALSNYNLALEQCRKHNDNYGIAQNVQNIAMINTVEANYKEALKNNELAIDINEKLNNQYGLAISYGNLGVLYMYILQDSTTNFKLPYDKNTSLKTAIHYLEKSVNIAQNLGALDIAQNFYKDLSDAEKMLGNNGKALEYYKLYSLYKDSVYSRKRLQRMSYLETERDIYIKDKQIQINNLKLEKRNNQIILIGAGSLLLMLSLVFLYKERRKSENLLLNILPNAVAKRLKNKEHPIADNLPEVSVLFADMVGFTKYTTESNPKHIVNMLNDIFTVFDEIVEKNGLEKIKTIGDCYMAAAGAPNSMSNHAAAAAITAIEIKKSVNNLKEKYGINIDFRIGVDCGQAIGGVLGKKKFVYDIWGDTVNTASRMESTGIAGKIHCTENFKEALEHKFLFSRGEYMQIKGKGMMQTWFLERSID